MKLTVSHLFDHVMFDWLSTLLCCLFVSFQLDYFPFVVLFNLCVFTFCFCFELSSISSLCRSLSSILSLSLSLSRSFFPLVLFTSIWLLTTIHLLICQFCIDILINAYYWTMKLRSFFFGNRNQYRINDKKS